MITISRKIYVSRGFYGFLEFFLKISKSFILIFRVQVYFSVNTILDTKLQVISDNLFTRFVEK